jgi:hypothetical protein
MENSLLPDCPICNDHFKVEKVSLVVEKAFPIPLGDYAQIAKEYKAVKWADRAYYIRKEYFTEEIKPFPRSLLFLFGTSSIKQLVRSFSKQFILAQDRWVSKLSEKFPADRENEITALWLLPILEKPGPIPAKTTFWRFVIESMALYPLRFLIPLFIFLLGLFLHILILAFIGLVLLVGLLLLTFLLALLLKIGVWALRKAHSEYVKKCKMQSLARKRWNNLYYCEAHDGVFTPESDTPFLHIKQVQAYLFKEAP